LRIKFFHRLGRWPAERGDHASLFAFIHYTPFMLARRFIGMLTGFCVLSLTLGRVGAGCERPSAPPPSASTSMTMTDHAGAQHELPAKHQQHTSCDSSSVVCCQAMTSCGLTLALSRTASAGDEFPAVSRVSDVSLQTLVSRIAAPETPPPKA
jgi:hypothetical protein